MFHFRTFEKVSSWYPVYIASSLHQQRYLQTQATLSNFARFFERCFSPMIRETLRVPRFLDAMQFLITLTPYSFVHTSLCRFVGTWNRTKGFVLKLSSHARRYITLPRIFVQNFTRVPLSRLFSFFSRANRANSIPPARSGLSIRWKISYDPFRVFVRRSRVEKFIFTFVVCNWKDEFSRIPRFFVRGRKVDTQSRSACSALSAPLREWSEHKSIRERTTSDPGSGRRLRGFSSLSLFPLPALRHSVFVLLAIVIVFHFHPSSASSSSLVFTLCFFRRFIFTRRFHSFLLSSVFYFPLFPSVVSFYDVVPPRGSTLCLAVLSSFNLVRSASLSLSLFSPSPISFLVLGSVFSPPTLSPAYFSTFPLSSFRFDSSRSRSTSILLYLYFHSYRDATSEPAPRIDLRGAWPTGIGSSIVNRTSRPILYVSPFDASDSIVESVLARLRYSD